MLPSNTDIAIIGAGTSGSFIASQLIEAGLDCVVFEKSRGRGGRCSRRQLNSDISIDLGAPEVLIDLDNNQRLRKYIDAWVKDGSLQSWSYQASRFNRIDQREQVTSLCGAPSMNTWHKCLSRHVNVRSNCKIGSITRCDKHWHLRDDKGQLIGKAKKVILTCPAAQAAKLLKPSGLFLDDKRLTRNNQAQFVCAIGFTKPSRIPVDLYRDGHRVLATAIRENSKPKRRLPYPLEEVWLLHSTDSWARQHASTPRDEMATLLADEFCKHFESHFNTPSERQILTSHYWLLARSYLENDAKPPFMWDKSLNIGCCGDWLSTGDVAGALNSALSLLDQITSTDQ